MNNELSIVELRERVNNVREKYDRAEWSMREARSALLEAEDELDDAVSALTHALRYRKD